MIKPKLSIQKVAVFSAVLVMGTVGVVNASEHTADTEFSQTINEGVLSTSILDDSQEEVANPGVVMSSVATSTDCQEDGSSGTLGENTERLYVDNPEAANNGWTLSIAATGGPGTNWDSGENTMSFDNATDDGCDTGQLSIDPSVGNIIADCRDCDNMNISTGAADAFDNGMVDSIELINAASESDDIWRGYLVDAAVSQTIPAEQPTGTYTLDMTVTVAAD